MFPETLECGNHTLNLVLTDWGYERLKRLENNLPQLKMVYDGENDKVGVNVKLENWLFITEEIYDYLQPTINSTHCAIEYLKTLWETGSQEIGVNKEDE